MVYSQFPRGTYLFAETPDLFYSLCLCGGRGFLPADTDVLEFSRKWLDAIHGTTSGLANFHAVVKGALLTVSFEELKYAMFKAEYTFMVAQAKKMQ